MKKLFISALSLLAVALGFTACTSDDDPASTPETPKQITVYATTEQPSATRTELKGNDTDGYAVVWSPDDQIKIGDETDGYAEFYLIDGEGETSGTFVRTGGVYLEQGTYVGYYPASYYGTSWPTEQTYRANNIPLGVPMKATDISVDADLNIAPISFKNEGGILRLNLKGEAKVTSITISTTDLDAITLSCGTAVQLDADMATPFYIAVPGADDPGTAYSGLKIVITDDAGKVCTKTAKVSITVQRSMITDITLTASGFKASTTGKAKATIGGSEVDVNWVQLWENGPKFAEYNVGATSATEFGGYYTPSSQSSEWGTAWRMPTSDEFNALLANCTCTWDDTNKGLLCIGKGDYVSNSIFLPAAGDDKGMNYKNSKGYYWSSTSNNYLKFDSSSQSMNSDAKPYYSYSVRKVLAE